MSAETPHTLAPRTPLPEQLTTTRVVAVLRAPEASAYRTVIPTLIDAGIVAIELTMTTRDTLEYLPSLVADYPEAQFGVGTVLSPEVAAAAIDGGAAFLVTPTLEEDVIDVAVAAGTPILAGGLTPTELHRAWARGASAVKVFPGGTVGASYVGQLHGPFPDMQVIPSGGVTNHTAVDWIDAGAVAVSAGGPLIGDAFRGGSLDQLALRASHLITLVQR